MKLKVGDQVLITSGKDKSRRGKIAKINISGAIVEGVNVYKRHRKGFSGQKGGIIEFSRPLPFANIALICPSCGNPTRVSYRLDKNGDKSRVCAKCEAVIENKIK